MMLAGFEPATHGEIYLNENPINRVPPHKRGIGMVFQNYALFPHMTVAENLAFPLEVRHMDKSEREQRVKRAPLCVGEATFATHEGADLSCSRRTAVGCRGHGGGSGVAVWLPAILCIIADSVKKKSTAGGAGHGYRY